MVPLRFIGEAFGCEVSYQNNVISINSPPVIIDGKEISSLVDRYSATGEYGYATIVNSNTVISCFLRTFENALGEEVAESYHPRQWATPTPDQEKGYMLIPALNNESLSLLDADGEQIKTVAFYQVMFDFVRNEDGTFRRDEEGNFMRIPPDNLPLFVVHDITADRWYEISKETVYAVLGTLEHYEAYGLRLAYRYGIFDGDSTWSWRIDRPAY